MSLIFMIPTLEFQPLGYGKEETSHRVEGYGQGGLAVSVVLHGSATSGEKKCQDDKGAQRQALR